MVDADKDQKADRVVTIARGLEMPNGVAMRDGSLYVAEVSRILRFDNIEASLDKPPAPAVVIDSYPKDRHHGRRPVQRLRAARPALFLDHPNQTGRLGP